MKIISFSESDFAVVLVCPTTDRIANKSEFDCVAFVFGN